MAAISTPERPIVPTTIRSGERVADPRYLLAEVTEVSDIAAQIGLETFAYTLERAWLVCVWLIEQQEKAAGRAWNAVVTRSHV